MAAIQPPSTVLDLVEQFERNLSACDHAQADRDEYTSGKCNESQFRRESLVPDDAIRIGAAIGVPCLTRSTGSRQ